MPGQLKTLAAPVILLAGLTAAGESAAQQPPAKDGPLLPALCRPGNAKLEILSPTGWAVKLPPRQAAATLQYRVKVSPGVADPRCAEHYPNWQPAGWTVKTMFGRAQKGEFESNDVADFTWQAGGTATLGPGQWVMLSQVVLPEMGPAKTVAFTIEQDEVNEPAKVAKSERRPRKRERPEPEGGPSGKEDNAESNEGKDAEKSGEPSQVLSDLLSKFGPKGKDLEKSPDPAETAEPKADPAATDGPAGDAREAKEPAGLGPKLAAYPKFLPKGKLEMNPRLKLAAKNDLKRIKLPVKTSSHAKLVKVNAQAARTKMVCHLRRVGSDVRRHCVRRS